MRFPCVILGLSLALFGCAPKAIVVEPATITEHIETLAKTKHCP
jgi:hypothetical protein